jgi:hypothetical protein
MVDFLASAPMMDFPREFSSIFESPLKMARCLRKGCSNLPGARVARSSSCQRCVSGTTLSSPSDCSWSMSLLAWHTVVDGTLFVPLVPLPLSCWWSGTGLLPGPLSSVGAVGVTSKAPVFSLGSCVPATRPKVMPSLMPCFDFRPASSELGRELFERWRGVAGAAAELTAGRVMVLGGDLLSRTVTYVAVISPVSSPVLPFRRAVFSRNGKVTLDTFIVGVFREEGQERRFISQWRRGVNTNLIDQVLVKVFIAF